MFNPQVNMPCNNALFSAPTMPRMQTVDASHPSFARLLEVAADHGDARAADVGRRLGESGQTLTNWKTRGVSKEGARKAQLAYGCDVNWLLGVDGIDVMLSRKQAAEPISLHDATITHPSPHQVQRVRVRGVAMVDAEGFWADLRAAEQDEYVGALGNDPDAYAIKIVGRRYFPVIDSGQCVVASPAAPLKVHKRVLVHLADGRHTVRLYLNHEAGLWMFASLTDANEVLELRDDQVAAVERVVAVSDSE